MMEQPVLGHSNSLQGWLLLGCGLAWVIVVVILVSGRAAQDCILRLKGFRWRRAAACQHFLIVGATGSGKTRSGVIPILLGFFRDAPGFGGLCIDIKGVLHEDIVSMARHAGRESDVRLLRIRSPDAPAGWQPPVRFNLVGDRSIPFATYAQCVVDTAVALGNRTEQSFFRSAAQIHIAKALEALAEVEFPVTLENVYNVLVDPADTRQVLQRLTSTSLRDHFRQYLDQPPEQLGGVVGTVRNYLHPFTQPEIAEVFCRDSTFRMADVDAGKIICLGLPQRFQTERRFVGTFLKFLFYLHALSRYDRSKEERRSPNQLIVLADECQHFVTVSESGLSDHSIIDIIREAGVAVVAATQSTTSLIPVLGADNTRVFTLNLRNRLIFTAADQADAVASADFIGKRRGRERSVNLGSGHLTESLREVDVYRVKPHQLTGLRKHQCILVHCEKGFRKVRIPPREPDGSISRWYRWPWLRA